MSTFFRFPHTPHLAWLGPSRPRDDKVLEHHARRALLEEDLVVEEKIDGANLGFSVDEHGRLRAQNRGKYLPLEEPPGQWKPLKRWLATRERERDLARALHPDLMLFGEWCYAVHTIHYARLPDWFLAFDVYDRAEGIFWSVDQRDALAARLGVEVVPGLGRGRFDVDGLRRLMGHSRLSDGPAEGVYVRHEAGDRLVARAKLVNPEFVQAIEEHWSRRTLRKNALADETGR